MSAIALENKTILVTGAAGFIGSNLVKRICEEVPSAKVVGIDSVNDYYDVALKEFRLNAWMMTKEFINRRHKIFSSISMQVNVPERSRRIFQICLFIRNMRMIMKWMRFLHWRRFRKKY